jgi:hypothetical protein
MGRLMLAALLMLALVSPALGCTTHCTTREDPAFKRWMTECSDGSRSVSTYDSGLKRWDTRVITPPKGEQPPAGWPTPGKRPR